MTASKTAAARDTKFRNMLRGMVNKGYMTVAELQDLAAQVGASPDRVSVYLSNARTRGATIVRRKVAGVTSYRLQKLPVVWTGRYTAPAPTTMISVTEVDAAILADETGMDYSQALVACNMD